MPLVNIDPRQLAHLIRDRRRSGGDRYDEVWDGVYVMSPLADNEHQELGLNLAMVITRSLGRDTRTRVFAGCNVSSRAKRWKQNYRCPDVAVFLPGNPAKDRQTHWYGGPDFAVEIESPFDRSREKFDFYAQVGVRELLFVARRPWSLELFRRAGKEWQLIGKSEPGTESPLLQSAVLPLGFRLVPGAKRPQIEVIQAGSDVRWLA
ncbi:MAG: Uma2 family endonuclease [Planctomycetaceae bacterium]|nr:Uma2 family endonuclease [Planctomycetaceae bacterium]